ncbi:MAG: HD domain-containing protein [Candidatus Melainabacteria bacterium]|nr:HD domain-containing protein [Candidatus Melainabacteria bacterium]
MSSTPQSASEVTASIRHRLVLAVDNLKMQDRAIILKALTFIEGHYDKYRRKTKTFPDRGIHLIAHPMRVALILINEIEIKDTGAISAALLHELVEWKRDKVSIADIERLFGRPIAMLVSILTKPPVEKDATGEERVQRLNTYYRRIEQASVVSKLVKLCDRLDSVREAPDWIDSEKQRQYLEETKGIYLPIAEASDSYLHEELLTAVEALEQSLNKGAKSTTDTPEIVEVGCEIADDGFKRSDEEYAARKKSDSI